MIIYIVYGLILWFTVFFSSSIISVLIITGVFKKREGIYVGFLTQTLFIALSIAVAVVNGEASIFDYELFLINSTVLTSTLQLSLVLFIYSIIINLLDTKIVRDRFFTEVIEENKYLAIPVLLILAPMGEEFLSRGLLEGYYLNHNVPLWIVVVIPAVLFSLIHLVPFKKLSKPVLTIVLIQVLIIGLLLSYYRAYTYSLIPVIMGHALSNIGGLLVYIARKK